MSRLATAAAVILCAAIYGAILFVAYHLLRAATNVALEVVRAYVTIFKAAKVVTPKGA